MFVSVLKVCQQHECFDLRDYVCWLLEGGVGLALTAAAPWASRTGSGSLLPGM